MVVSIWSRSTSTAGRSSTWARGEKRNWRQVVELLIGVADALATAHDAGILHRDIKPDNILLTKNGYAKLGGLRSRKGHRGRRERDSHGVGVPDSSWESSLGTIEYLSPEQARGAVLDSRSDIFSFGIVLYELLSGRRPFTGSTDLHVVEAVLHETPAPLGDEIPFELRGVVEKALEKDPSDRYQSMRDFVVDLRRLTRHTDVARRQRQSLRRARGDVGLLAGVAAVAVAVIAGVGLWWGLRNGEGAAVSSPQIRSIAVLPMDNLSADASEEYFSDGMTEQLISSLAQVRALKVISRTSVMQYKKSPKNLTEIARELGADAIIEGSVRRVGGRVRVTAQLIHAASDAHLWAQDFDHDFSDVLKLQAEVADAIVREIKVQVTPEEAKRLTASRPVNPKAYELFMLGRYHYWQRTPDDWKKSVEELEQAVRLQPDYAPAHAALSMAWLTKDAILLFTQSEGSMRRGRAESHRARPVACRRACGACGHQVRRLGLGRHARRISEGVRAEPGEHRCLWVLRECPGGVWSIRRRDPHRRTRDSRESALDRIAQQLRVRALHGQEIFGRRA